MGEEWGEWQLHDGNGCPCVGMFTEARWLHDDGTIADTPSWGGRYFIAEGGASWTWRIVSGRAICDEECNPIIRYRILIPRALADLRALIADLPIPVPA